MWYTIRVIYFSFKQHNFIVYYLTWTFLGFEIKNNNPPNPIKTKKKETTGAILSIYHRWAFYFFTLRSRYPCFTVSSVQVRKYKYVHSIWGYLPKHRSLLILPLLFFLIVKSIFRKEAKDKIKTLLLLSPFVPTAVLLEAHPRIHNDQILCANQVPDIFFFWLSSFSQHQHKFPLVLVLLWFLFDKNEW